jgi:hypothetical protein
MRDAIDHDLALGDGGICYRGTALARTKRGRWPKHSSAACAPLFGPVPEVRDQAQQPRLISATAHPRRVNETVK